MRILFALQVLISIGVSAQNLVTNPGFETYAGCPNTYNQVSLATGWKPSYQNNVGSTHTEFLNSCAGSFSSGFGAPLNVWGNQSPATGSGYMAIATMAPSIAADYRENIFSLLKEPLKIGTAYRISFKVSLSDNCRKATNNMGLKFSTTPTFLVNDTSHLRSETIVTSQTDWILIADTIIADSSYKYVAIGNFHTDINTLTQTVCSSCPFQHSGYYFDDVEVTPVSLASVVDQNKQSGYTLFPNPTDKFATILSSKPIENTSVMITDLTGKTVLDEMQVNVSGNKFLLDLSGISAGVYLIVISNNYSSESIRMVISR